MEKKSGFWRINFLTKAIEGVLSIILINQILDYRNIPVSIGINLLSIFVAGSLGIPGIAMLYGIMFYQLM